MVKRRKVERPTRKSEYTIEYGSGAAGKGWRDLLAQIRGPMVDCWEFLTQTPQDVTPRSYPLKGRHATVTRDGKEHDRWQYKPTIKGDARIWYYVEGQTVYLEQVHTQHPYETK